MKAIKIASGVAVSALALAISAQANAAAHEGGDTEFSWNATGSMTFIYVNDFESSVQDVDLDNDGDDFDSGDASDANFGLQTTLNVKHGPFSGDFDITAEKVNDGGTATVTVDNIVVTEGAISFGMLDELTSTSGYAYDMDNDDDGPGEADAGNSFHDGADTKAAIRYTMDGLKVQLEGANGDSVEGSVAADDTAGLDTDYGLGVEYSGSADALSYIAQGQIRGSDDSNAGDDAYTYAGVGVTYTMDMLTAKVGLNNYGAAEKVTELGFELTATPVDGLSVYAKGVNYNLSGNDAAGIDEEVSRYRLGAAFTVDAITLTGEYTMNTVDADVDNDTVKGKVGYAQDMIAAYASVEVAGIEGDAGDPLIEVGVNYTTESGVRYAADYDFQTDVQNDITLSAAYAF